MDLFYKRRLPHWQPEDAALFITWRLAGSLPVHLRSLRTAEEAMEAFFAEDAELDRALVGPVWLNDPRIAQCLVDALRFGEN